MIFLLSQEKIRSQWSVGNDNKKSFLEIVQSDFTSSSSLLHVPPVTPLCLSGGGAALKHRTEVDEKVTLASIEIPTRTTLRTLFAESPLSLPCLLASCMQWIMASKYFSTSNKPAGPNIPFEDFFPLKTRNLS